MPSEAWIYDLLRTEYSIYAQELVKLSMRDFYQVNTSQYYGVRLRRGLIWTISDLNAVDAYSKDMHSLNLLQYISLMGMWRAVLLPTQYVFKDMS